MTFPSVSFPCSIFISEHAIQRYKPVGHYIRRAGSDRSAAQGPVVWHVSVVNEYGGLNSEQPIYNLRLLRQVAEVPVFNFPVHGVESAGSGGLNGPG